MRKSQMPGLGLIMHPNIENACTAAETLLTDPQKAIAPHKHMETHLPSELLWSRGPLGTMLEKPLDGAWASEIPRNLLPAFLTEDLDEDDEIESTWSVEYLYPVSVTRTVVDIALAEEERQGINVNVEGVDKTEGDCQRYIVTGSSGEWSENGDGRVAPIYARCGSKIEDDNYISETHYRCHLHGGIWSVF